MAFDPASLAAENTPQPLWVVDASGRVVWSNAAAGRLSDDVGGWLSKRLAAGSFAADTMVGERAGYRFLLCPISGADACHWLVAAEPIPTRPESHEARDPVTGALSRAALEQRLAGWTGPQGPNAFALAFVDIDDFKAVNDRHGHPAADAALAEIARRLQAALRAGDLVARYGGDELVLLVAGVEPGESWQAVASRLQTSLDQPHEFETGPDFIGCSIGVAFFDRSTSQSPATLVQSADRAMYQQKRAKSARA